jgi:hypothetical protein
LRQGSDSSEPRLKHHLANGVQRNWNKDKRPSAKVRFCRKPPRQVNQVKWSTRNTRLEHPFRANGLPQGNGGAIRGKLDRVKRARRDVAAPFLGSGRYNETVVS